VAPNENGALAVSVCIPKLKGDALTTGLSLAETPVFDIAVLGRGVNENGVFVASVDSSGGLVSGMLGAGIDVAFVSCVWAVLCSGFGKPKENEVGATGVIGVGRLPNPGFVVVVEDPVLVSDGFSSKGRTEAELPLTVGVVENKGKGREVVGPVETVETDSPGIALDEMKPGGGVISPFSWTVDVLN
jgi:hypothetical protein